MTNFNDFLGGSDNLFKYLTSIGIIALLVALVYPTQKKQELELIINEYQKEQKIIEFNVDNLNRYILEISNKDSIKTIHHLLSDTTALLNIRDKLPILKEKLSEIERQTIELESQKQRIVILTKHLRSFRDWEFGLLITGVLCFAIGLIFWILQTCKIFSSNNKNNSTEVDK